MSILDELRAAIKAVKAGASIEATASAMGFEYNDVRDAILMPHLIDRWALRVAERRLQAVEPVATNAPPPPAKGVSPAPPKATRRAKQEPTSGRPESVAVPRRRAMELLSKGPPAAPAPTVRRHITRAQEAAAEISAARAAATDLERAMVEAAIKAGKVTACPPGRAVGALRWPTETGGYPSRRSSRIYGGDRGGG